MQASIEIQRSARIVAQDNARLRRLLRHVGVDEKTINSWDNEIEMHEGEGSDMLNKCVLGREAGGAYPQAGPTVGELRQDCPGAMTQVSPSAQVRLCSFNMESRPIISPARNEHPKDANHSATLCDGHPVDHADLVSKGPREAFKSYTDCKSQSSIAYIPTSENTFMPPPPAPCKLLTHLHANPGADITQMRIASDENEQNLDVVDDGVPCSRAYQMLTHYATTESKLDAVAQILEKGCVPNGPGGGCRVKSKTIWKALDDLCL